jgi:putative SOS response-associated peptidase YedK
MCGRYYLKTPPAQLAARFQVTIPEEDFHEGENIAPTETVPAVLNDSPDRLTMVRWGLIPSWAKELKIGNKMFNARADGISEKPSFRGPFKKRRCLVVADGFYEWRKNPDGTKTPFRFELRSGEPFAFAGLWDVSKAGGEDWIKSCTIITTDANDLVREAHDRMPVMLPREVEREWLDVENGPSSLALLRPYPAEEMRAVEVPADFFKRGPHRQISLESL